MFLLVALQAVHMTAIYLVLCLPFVAAVCAHIDRIVCALVLLHLFHFILYYKINELNILHCIIIITFRWLCTCRLARCSVISTRWCTTRTRSCGGKSGAENAFFGAVFTQNASIYQDRLRTDMGKTQNKSGVFRRAAVKRFVS